MSKRPEFTDEERAKRKAAAIALSAEAAQKQAQIDAKSAQVSHLLFSSLYQNPTVLVPLTPESSKLVKDVLDKAHIECLPEGSLSVSPVQNRYGFNIYQTEESGDIHPQAKFMRITATLYRRVLSLDSSLTKEVQDLIVIGNNGRSRIIHVAEVLPEPMDRLDFTASLAKACLSTLKRQPTPPSP